MCESVHSGFPAMQYAAFYQNGAIAQTITDSGAGTSGGSITHLLIPYAFATSPDTTQATPTQVFLNTGWEYLQLVPSDTAPNSYLIREATEYFARKEQVPAFNWTSYGADAVASDGVSQALQAVVYQFSQLLDTSVTCSAWAQVQGSVVSPFYTTDQSSPPLATIDRVTYCDRMRASAQAPHTALRPNGAFVAHQSGGLWHVLAPFTGTLYNSISHMNSRIGYWALIVTPPQTAGAAYTISRATQFVTTQQIAFPPAPPVPLPDCGSGTKVSVSLAAALVVLFSLFSAAVTALVCRQRRAIAESPSAYAQMSNP